MIRQVVNQFSAVAQEPPRRENPEHQILPRVQPQEGGSNRTEPLAVGGDGDYPGGHDQGEIGRREAPGAAQAKPEATFRLVERPHWITLTLSLITVFGAVAGA